MNVNVKKFENIPVCELMVMSQFMGVYFVISAGKIVGIEKEE